MYLDTRDASSSEMLVAMGPSRASVAMQQVSFNVRDMPGVVAPLGFFDPLGFTEGISVGRAKFLREVEIKHGRVAMLASVGFVVGEQVHPLWGGAIDVPSYIAFQEVRSPNTIVI